MVQTQLCLTKPQGLLVQFQGLWVSAQDAIIVGQPHHAPNRVGVIGAELRLPQYVHVRRLKEYTAAKAPADLAGIGQVLPRFGHFATGMLIPNLLAEDPDEQLLEGVTACSYAGKEVVGDKQAYHLRFKQGDFDWEAWVAAEGKPLVLKVTMTGRTDTGTFVTEEMYDNWKVNQTPGNDAFRFTAPADVKQVKAFGKCS